MHLLFHLPLQLRRLLPAFGIFLTIALFSVFVLHSTAIIWWQMFLYSRCREENSLDASSFSLSISKVYLSKLYLHIYGN
jgi:cytoskeletal protein RodZ